MTGKLRPEKLLPKLTKNKSYIKKIKFSTKRKEAAAADEKGYQVKKKSKVNSETTVKRKKTKKSSPNASVKKGTKKIKLTSTKLPGSKKLKKNTIARVEGLNKVKKTVTTMTATSTKMVTDAMARQEEQQDRQANRDKQLIARVISGDEANSSVSPSSAATKEAQELLQYPYLPFLEDYAEQKRSETVSEQELLRNAHEYFRDLGKKESSMRRAAAKRLREMKEMNRRGGDKDGFRYVVPRNVKEVVRQMMQSTGAEGADIDPSQLVSTFGGGDELTMEAAEAEKPVHRRKRKRSTYSDFYQFQVSKRWTRNAENFLNRGRASKSMFEAKRQSRSIKNL